MLSSTFYLVSVVVCFVNSLLIFHLFQVFSDSMRFHKIVIYAVCVFNGVAAAFILQSNFSSPMIYYAVCSVVYFVEYVLLYKGRLIGKIGVALGLLLHLFILRAILISVASIFFSIPLHDVIFNQEILSWINLLAFATQIVILIVFIKLAPLHIIKAFIANKEFFNNLLFFVTLLVVYMTYNSNIFLIDFYSVNLAVQVIVIALVASILFLIRIIHYIKLFNLGLYKEKIKELEKTIEKERSFAAAVLNFATVVMEVNCMKDKIELLLINSVEMNPHRLPGLVEFLGTRLILFAHEEDTDKILKISPESLIEDFISGITEREIEYRSQKMEPAAEHLGVKSCGEEYYWFRMRLSTRVNEETDEIIALITIGEIHEEKEEVLALKTLTETDQMTGLYNKEAFITSVNEHLQAGGKGALFMFDIDNFKGINDNMGHAMGDEVLREVSGKISTLFRDNDIVGRIGGDEFVAFLKGTVNQNTIKNKAKKICSDIRKTYTAENKVSIDISSSIGIALAPKDGVDFESLFSFADLAMYASKSSGKNTFTLYDKNLVEGFKPQEREAYMRQRAEKHEE